MEAEELQALFKRITQQQKKLECGDRKIRSSFKPSFRRK